MAQTRMSYAESPRVRRLSTAGEKSCNIGNLAALFESAKAISSDGDADADSDDDHRCSARPELAEPRHNS